MAIPNKVEPTNVRAVDNTCAPYTTSVYFFLALGSAKGCLYVMYYT
jgi:hypothetical protein